MPMDERTRDSLARIAVEWHKHAAPRVGDRVGDRVSDRSDEMKPRKGISESSGMSPIALRHRRYAQLIKFRKAS